MKKGHSGDQRYLQKEEDCFLSFVCVHDLSTRCMGTLTGDGKIAAANLATLSEQMENPK